jgi:hypothetical protein
VSEVTLHHFTYAAAVNCKLMRDALGGKVNAIVAYKLDELTTNRVCRGMVTGVGGGKKTCAIHKELRGFDSAIAGLETLPGFDQK